jgi:hypothetical protein
MPFEMSFDLMYHFADYLQRRHFAFLAENIIIKCIYIVISQFKVVRH